MKIAVLFCAWMVLTHSVPADDSKEGEFRRILVTNATKLSSGKPVLKYIDAPLSQHNGWWVIEFPDDNIQFHLWRVYFTTAPSIDEAERRMSLVSMTPVGVRHNTPIKIGDDLILNGPISLRFGTSLIDVRGGLGGGYRYSPDEARKVINALLAGIPGVSGKSTK